MDKLESIEKEIIDLKKEIAALKANKIEQQDVEKIIEDMFAKLSLKNPVVDVA